MTFTITNIASGTDLGTYTAATAADALDLMARDAGYSDYADACSIHADDDGYYSVDPADHDMLVMEG